MKEMQESKARFEELRDIVLGHSRLMETWIGGQSKNEHLIVKLMRGRKEDKEIIYQTQEQVNEIYTWLKDQKSRETVGRKPLHRRDQEKRVTPEKSEKMGATL